MGNTFDWTDDKKRRYMTIAIVVIIIVILTVVLHNLVNGTQPPSDEDPAAVSTQTVADSNRNTVTNMPKYEDPVPIYIGDYNGPFDIFDENAGVSNITDVAQATKLAAKYLPGTIGIELDSLSRDDSTGLTCYHFLQIYGPLLVENAAIDVYVDDWGNWKRIEGRYAVLTGSIAEIDEKVEKNAEYRILLCEEQQARTVVVTDDGKYLARDGQTEVTGI